MPGAPGFRHLGPVTPAAWAGTFFRLLLAAVLLAAGLAKILDVETTVRAVRAYRVLPEAVVPAFGFAMPVVELALGALLALGFRVRQAAAAALGLMLLYTVALVQAWARGLQIDCGCFGAGSWVGYPQEVARDLALALAAGFLVVRPRTRLALEAT